MTVRLFAAFFLFGATMCAVTIAMLAFPGSVLDPLWRLNPEAQVAFRGMGVWALVMMIAVGAACAFSAIGLLSGREWGRRLAIAVLVVNLIGDTAGAIVRHDPRTLIGLPIAGAMIVILTKVELVPHD